MNIGDKVVVPHPQNTAKWIMGEVLWVSTYGVIIYEVDTPLGKVVASERNCHALIPNGTDVEIIDPNHADYGKSGWIRYDSPIIENDWSIKYRLSMYNSNTDVFVFPDQIWTIKPLELEKKPVAAYNCTCSSYDLLHHGHKCGIKPKRWDNPGE